jgi:hypothetical protein
MKNSNIQHSDSSVTLSMLVSEAVYRIVVGIERIVTRCTRQAD